MSEKIGIYELSCRESCPHRFLCGRGILLEQSPCSKVVNTIIEKLYSSLEMDPVLDPEHRERRYRYPRQTRIDQNHTVGLAVDVQNTGSPRAGEGLPIQSYPITFGEVTSGYVILGEHEEEVARRVNDEKEPLIIFRSQS